MTQKRKHSLKGQAAARRQYIRQRRSDHRDSLGNNGELPGGHGESPTGRQEPALSQGKSLNALRLAPPQGSLRTHKRGIPPRPDSPACDCTSANVPSPEHGVAGQSQMIPADSQDGVCTVHVPSAPSDAARAIGNKDANIDQTEQKQMINKQEPSCGNAYIETHDVTTSHNKTEKDVAFTSDFFDKKCVIKRQCDTKQCSGSSKPGQNEDNMPGENMIEGIRFPDDLPRNNDKTCVLGSFHQGEYMHFGENSGKQCVPNSLASIAYNEVVHFTHWETSDLDTILRHGNELYTFLQRSSTIHNDYLLVSELPESMDIFGRLFDFQFSESLSGIFGHHIDTNVDGWNMFSLTEALQVSLDTSKSCFVCFGGNTFAVIEVDGCYCVFDSHARDNYGFLSEAGKSICLKFSSIPLVSQHCCELAKSLNIPDGSQFEITGAQVVRAFHGIALNNKESISEMTNANKATENETEETEVIFIHASHVKAFSFHPLTKQSKENLCKTLCLSYIGGDNPAKMVNNIGRPSKTRKITRDGNCFYRALSFAISGTEESHLTMRKELVHLMQRSPEQMKPYLRETYRSMEHYLQSSNGNKSGTWATEVEIFAAVLLLKMDIYIYSSEVWQKFDFSQFRIGMSTGAIYLKHVANCHYDVVETVETSPDILMSITEPFNTCEGKSVESVDELYKRDQNDDQQLRLSSLNPSATNSRIGKEQNTLLENYFIDQSQKNCFNSQKYIFDSSLKEIKRRQYIKEYMRHRRKDQIHRWNERPMEKHSKRTFRQVESNRAAEREKDKHSRKSARQIESKRAAEREKEKKSKISSRQVESKRTAEKERDKHSRKSVREIESRRAAEKKRDKHSMKSVREIESRRAAERKVEGNSKKSYRQVESKRTAEKERDKHSRKSVREIESRRAAERKVEGNSKKTYRQVESKRTAEKERDKHSRKSVREIESRRAAERKVEGNSKKSYRQVESKRTAEKERDKHSRKSVREIESRRAAEREIERNSKKSCRQVESKRAAEKKRDKHSRKSVREIESKRAAEREMENKSKKRSRENVFIKEKERIAKKQKRTDTHWKEQERKRDQDRKSEQRLGHMNDDGKEEKKNKKKYKEDIISCIAYFHDIIAKGPLYVCSCCHQTWFEHSVTSTDGFRARQSEDIIGKFLTNKLSVDNKEYICRTCTSTIRLGKTPTLSVANKMGFPKKPKELYLHQLEERLVSLRIPFMQIRELPRGRQLSIKGNVVNVPVDIQPIVKSLPRQIDTDLTIPVKLKKKLSYKKSDFVENVRPLRVITSLHWLMENSPLYKDSGIQIDQGWVETIKQSASEIVQNFCENENNDKSSNAEISDLKMLGNEDTLIDNPLLNLSFNGEINDFSKQPVQISEASHETPDQTGYESDNFSEVDEQEKMTGNADTLLDNSLSNLDSVFTYAPGEGQTPLSLYQDKDAEYLSFPTVFCGQRRVDNSQRDTAVHYSDIVKWELRNIDRRAANNVPNIFFKMKKIQIKQISDKVNLVLRKCKTKGKTITVKDVLEPHNIDNIVRLDEGYYIFRTLRSSPPYLEAKKKEIFAMIRQLGLPTWFGSFSAADTRWTDLLSILSDLNSENIMTMQEIESLSWNEKTQLVQQDPITCSRYLDHRVQEFIKVVLNSHHEPIGKLKDYFYRVEFQQRGSPHIHMLMWIDNAPCYKEDNTNEITGYIDQYVSCSTDVHPDLLQLVQLQVHKHSKSCRKKGKAICRFGFPQPPMSKTQILQPLIEEAPDDIERYKHVFSEIEKKMNEKFTDDTNVSIVDFLQSLNLSEEEYIKAIRSSLNGPKVFLQRQPNELRVNPYMKNLLPAWKANHDLQFVLDPYACAIYIVSYISKSQRGMSLLLDQACKEAKQGNMDLRKQVRHIGNQFLNSVEVSAQEAAYLTLQLPLTKTTREVTFINTSKPEDRTFLLKDKASLEKLPETSTDIQADNIINRYGKRPKQLEHWCLADYVSELEIKYPKDKKRPEINWETNDDADSDSDNDEDLELTDGLTIKLKNGITIKQRKNKRVLRYVRFNKATDSENHYREKLLLFTNWRNEEELLKNFNTYEEHYKTLKNFIDSKARKYEQNADVLDEAWKRADDEINFDLTAPSNEQREDEDGDEPTLESDMFVHFNPEREDYQRHSDIGADVGLSARAVDININTQRMPTGDYLHLVRSLNKGQKEIFLHVVHWVITKEEPLHLFLTGGAGVGKSVVIRVLYEALNRHLSTEEGQNPQECRVLLCAPTGKAAFNIHGCTIHSAFKIPACQGFHCRQLDSDSLNTLRVKYRNLEVVMIDEVSMVGNSQLALVNERLKQIKGKQDHFGGVHIVLIGDLYQLKPVMDAWIFENLKHGFGPLATNLWKELFSMHELTQIMRQKDDLAFSELLNRLREGKQTNEDLLKLKERLTHPGQPDYPFNAPHLFTTNKNVDAFNQNIFLTSPNEKVTINAFDTVESDDSTSVKKSLLERIPNDASKTAGLPMKVCVAVGLKCDLTSNIDVSDGLVNGTACTVQYIERKQNNTLRPSIVWVQFEDGTVGQQRRQQYTHLQHVDVSKNWTPIFDIKRTFQYLRKTVARIQFPLRLSAAKTVHKSQGDTMDDVVVDLGGARCFPHAHYVAFSRVKNIAGLHVLGMNADKMSTSRSVCDEMKRLRSDAQLELCYVPLYKIPSEKHTVAFHNTRSLHCHYDDIKHDLNLMTADIIGISESWLKVTDGNNYTLPGYNIYRYDAIPTDTNCRPHRGLVMYVKNHITVHAIHQYSETTSEGIFITVDVNGKSCQVMTVYSSPTCSTKTFLKAFQTHMLPTINKQLPLIIGGDFNMDLSKTKGHIVPFMETCLSCIQVVTKSTHSSGSLIDHIYTNAHVVEADVIESVWSDHKIVYVAIDI